MVNNCACGGCTNSNLSGHRIFTFPKNRNSFRAWVRFVQVRRRDFTVSSATRNAVVCSAHFRPDDYNPGDMTECRMGFRNRHRVRLIAGAVPSIHTGPSWAPPSTLAKPRVDSARRKRELCRVLRDAASNEGTDAPPEVLVKLDPDEEAFPLAPQPPVPHCVSQSNIKSFHRSPAVQVQPKKPTVGTQKTWFESKNINSTAQSSTQLWAETTAQTASVMGRPATCLAQCKGQVKKTSPNVPGLFENKLPISLTVEDVSVNMDCLLQLFRKCGQCRGDCVVNMEMSSSCFTVVQRCNKCNLLNTWNSQPRC